jgi:hypothetical protein
VCVCVCVCLCVCVCVCLQLCTLVARAAHNGREDGARGVVTGKTSLAHAGAVVYHEGLDFFIGGHGSAGRQRLNPLC